MKSKSGRGNLYKCDPRCEVRQSSNDEFLLHPLRIPPRRQPADPSKLPTLWILQRFVAEFTMFPIFPFIFTSVFPPGSTFILPFSKIAHLQITRHLDTMALLILTHTLLLPTVHILMDIHTHW
ncbi:hypothetical protein Y032_0042g589 [Ancylostoma ceylanicum]|uniref:Uncharacterized protein n=1 Tax=Ancylostoma ceylanicum TaxID=53326 RepID=A0A016UGD0_9BILA|nr:hypothetical protein Y032_0042g589 [Ancylostoma ceylanicum]